MPRKPRWQLTGKTGQPFSVRHATLNAGLGLGALIAAAIVDTRHPCTFTALYLADAATYLAFIPILLTHSLPRTSASGCGARQFNSLCSVASIRLLRPPAVVTGLRHAGS